MQLGEQSRGALGRTGPPRTPGDREQRCSGRSAWVHPCLLWGQAAEGPASACRLSSPLKAVGLWPCSFLPSSLRLETSPPPRLLRKLLSLSPQVIFHHVALKSWALLGEGRGEQDPLTPSYLWRGGPETSLMSKRGQPFPGGHLSIGIRWLNTSLGGGSEISGCHAVKVTSCYLQRVRRGSTEVTCRGTITVCHILLSKWFLGVV